MMTPEQKDLVQSTWAQVAPIAPAAADLFYDRLFDEAPEIASLFRNRDMSVQKSRLVAALSHTIAGLRDEDALRADLAELGRRHAGYGVRETHYESVGAALLWTLESGLGDAWSDAAREAWSQAYGFIAQEMIQGAQEDLA